LPEEYSISREISKEEAEAIIEDAEEVFRPDKKSFSGFEMNTKTLFVYYVPHPSHKEFAESIGADFWHYNHYFRGSRMPKNSEKLHKWDFASKIRCLSD